jgi:hypothetical protein
MESKDLNFGINQKVGLVGTKKPPVREAFKII